MAKQGYDQRYEAARKTLGELLSTASPPIKVPEWQRSYSWQRNQVEEFWADLTAFSERYSDTNIQGREYFLGSVVLVTEPSQYLLLDGQQRLATTTILLSVLRDARLKYDKNSAEHLQWKYISDRDEATDIDQPSLTLNSYDRNYFRDQIQSGDASEDKPKLKSHKLMLKAKQYFAEQVEKEYAACKDAADAHHKVNLRYTTVLTNHMSVVAVTSSDEDNAAAVFETLNDRGIGLSTTDLLRSLLMRRAKIHDRNEIGKLWHNILTNSDQASVDRFLRHYWISIHGDEKARSLYRAVKEYIEDHKVASLKFTQDLSRASETYHDIRTYVSPNPELRRLLRDIGNLGATMLYPALLSAIAAANGNLNISAKAINFVDTLVKLFVRYSVVAQKESSILESTVYDVAKNLRETSDFEGMTLILQERSPDITEFAKQFSVVSVSRVQTATYLLREIDQFDRITNELEVAGTDKVHLEHVYPKEPADNWPKLKSHLAWLNRLGNLTLLDKSANTSIKNDPFGEKKKAYAKSLIPRTQQLTAYEIWSEEQIEARQREMALAAVHIWKFPDEQLPDDLAKIIANEPVDLEDVEELPEYPEGVG